MNMQTREVLIKDGRIDTTTGTHQLRCLGLGINSKQKKVQLVKVTHDFTKNML